MLWRHGVEAREGKPWRGLRPGEDRPASAGNTAHVGYGSRGCSNPWSPMRMLPRSVGPVAACSGRVGQVEDSGTPESMTFGFVEDEVPGLAKRGRFGAFDLIVGGGHG